MTPFSKLAEITRYAASAERRPFSVLVSSPVPTMGHATCFYFGGWNVLPSDVSFLAVLPPQKTIKTECGKRVAISRVDNHDIECCACLYAIYNRARILLRLRQYEHVLTTCGLDAANDLAATWAVLTENR